MTNPDKTSGPAPETPPSPIARRLPLLLSAVVAGAIVGYGIVHNLGALQSRSTGGTGADATDCAPAVALAKTIDPLATGEVAAVTMATKPVKVPDLAFNDGDGHPKKLSDWRGKTVLVNLWATWCVPCRKEMPALDRLQGKLGSDKFQVVAINIDTRDLDRPKTFLKEANLTRLGNFSDAKAKVFQDLKSIGLALGMPTSVLIDGKGCQIGHIAGPAEWDSDDAVKLIEASLGQ